ncbi:MAG: ABC transporter permease [Cypionkella sp.]
MLYALKIAARYLTAPKAQTALLILGAAIGVLVFIFMSALIGGLAELILSQTAGDMAHITIQAEAAEPPFYFPAPPCWSSKGPPDSPRPCPPPQALCPGSRCCRV